MTFSLPIAAHVEIETGDSTNDQRRDVQGKLYTPRSKSATEAFPAWELTPASHWNYALCLDDQSLTRLVQITWRSPSDAPFDSAQAFVTLRVPARTVEGWDVVQRPNTRQENNWFSRGKWFFNKMRKIEGPFTFTPPLPSRKTLQAQLSQEIEWIELVPYGSTLLRLTVFPQAVDRA